MLLRSSSTPVLGSLLSSFPESPNHHLSSESHHIIKHPTPPTHHHPSLSLNYTSSPITRSTLESSSNSFRKSNSEGNLVGLGGESDDHFGNSSISRPPKCFQKRGAVSVLETIPSFSYHNINTYRDTETSDEEEEFEMGNYRNVENLEIGFGGAGGSGGSDFVRVAYGRDGGDGKRQGAEEHYRKLVEENPGNPLFLRNYAQYLFETKKDLAKSEELYSRAILADPGDGEILSQYAKLIWELHHDKERALNYFETAVQAAPTDSHVHAAYASFLWDIEEEEEEEEDDGSLYSSSIFNSQVHKGFMASAST